MCSVRYAVILVCMIAINGCSPESIGVSREQSEVAASPTTPVVDVGVQKDSPSLTVEGFSLTGRNLTLRYCVTNTLPHDIWICTTQAFQDFYEGDRHPNYTDVRIADGGLWLRRRVNLEQNCFVTGFLYAGYRRLTCGQAWSDTILLPLPVHTSSTVYASSQESLQVVLNRVVLQVGYFDEDLHRLIRQHSREPAQQKSGRLEFGISQSKGDPNLALVPYLDQDRWDGLALERTIEVVITDVVVPGVSGRRTGPSI